MNRIKVLLSLFMIVLIILSCQVKKRVILDHTTIIKESDKVYEKLVKVRRDLHKYPELAGQEERTQDIIKKYLLELGLEVLTDGYGKSVIGILRGNENGRKIAWRADMDALPHDFPDEVEFKSKVKGVQHGCGHDIHMAIGLGIAEVFSKYKNSLPGTLYFIFQPEEETFQGARKMIEEGLFSKIDPDEIYALHVSPLPVGKIMVKSNEMFAHQRRVQIVMKNEITELQANALYENIKNFMTRVQPNSKPWVFDNVLDPKIGLSSPNTIFKDYLFMDNTPYINSENEKLIIRTNLYETNQKNLESILLEIKKHIQEGEYRDLFQSISFIQGNPTVLNDKYLTQESVAFLSEIYGDELMLPNYGQIPYFNDDFYYFQNKIPGVYFLLGGSNFEKGMIAMNHAPNFMVDEECIKVGVNSFSLLILNRLNKN